MSSSNNESPMILNPLEYMEARWLFNRPGMSRDEFSSDAELYGIIIARSRCIYDFVQNQIRDEQEFSEDNVIIDNSDATLMKCIIPVYEERFVSGSDQCTNRSISTSQRMYIKKRHPMANNSEILYYREESSDNTFIVTTKGVSYKHYSSLFEIEWRKLRLVDYDEKDARFYFYTIEKEEPVFGIGNYDLLKWKSDPVIFSNLINAIADCFTDNSSDKFNKALDLINAEQYNEALQIVDELIQKETTDLGVYHYLKAGILLGQTNPGDDVHKVDEQFELAKECLEKDKNYSLHSELFSLWADLKEMSGDLLAARNCHLLCLEKADKDKKKQCLKDYSDFLSNHRDYWDNYTGNIEYSQRKLIMPVKDVSGCVCEGISAFAIDEMPAKISFPVGHPVVNELYIGHPYNPSIYVPYNEHEEIFLKDKIDELSYVLQCLGAKEISITSRSGLTLEEINEQNSLLKGRADIKALSVSGQQESTITSSDKSSFGRKISQKQIFSPTKAPYVPDNLIWYPHEVQWQRLARQRINGNGDLLEHHLELSTKDTSFVANKEISRINASAKFLWAKGNVENENIKSLTKDESKETRLIVEVVFMPIEELNAANSDNLEKALPLVPLSKAEEEYKEEVLFYLNDGEIGDLERKSLNRRRVKLGISEERASEIELMCQPVQTLSDEEVEYMEIYKEICGNGEVSPRMRKILMREADNLGISYDRASELEKEIK